VIATGAAYRRPQLKNLPRFEGAGVYYAATFVEAQLCGGEEVIVVGGGNAVGQAAVFLAETTKRVHMLRQVCQFGREHVALLNSPYRRDSCNSIPATHGDHST
jgi:thioredoxin reductase